MQTELYPQRMNRLMWMKILHHINHYQQIFRPQWVIRTIEESNGDTVEQPTGEVSSSPPLILNHRKHAISRPAKFLHTTDYENLLIALKHKSTVFPDFKKGFTESLALLNSVYWRADSDPSTLERALPINELISVTCSKCESDDFEKWKKTADYDAYTQFIEKYEFCKDADDGLDDYLVTNTEADNSEADNLLISSMQFSCFGGVFGDVEIEGDNKNEETSNLEEKDDSIVTAGSLDIDSVMTTGGLDEDEEDDDIVPLFEEIEFDIDWARKQYELFMVSRSVYVPRNDIELFMI
eukprot:919091_1